MTEQENFDIIFSNTEHDKEVIGLNYYDDKQNNSCVVIGYIDPVTKKTGHLNFKIKDLLKIIAQSTGVVDKVKDTLESIEQTGKVFSNGVNAAINAFNNEMLKK